MSYMIVDSSWHNIRNRVPNEGQCVRIWADGRIFSCRYEHRHFIGQEEGAPMTYKGVEYWQPDSNPFRDGAEWESDDFRHLIGATDFLKSLAGGGTTP